MLEDEETRPQQYSLEASHMHRIYRRAIRTVLIVILLPGVLFGLSRCGPAPADPIAQTADGPVVLGVESELVNSTGSLQIGDMAPDFVYTLADGSTHQLSDLRGQKVLLNFWATWCGPCKIEMPDIEEASRRFRDENLVVLAVNHTESVDAIEPFGRDLGLTFPLIANQSGDIIDAYVARGLPTTFFINTDGTISYKQIGMIDLAFIQQRLEEMQ